MGLGIIIGAAAGGLIAGFLVCEAVWRPRRKKLAHWQAEAVKNLDLAERAAAKIEDLREVQKATKAKSEQYRRIAKTHDVKMPERGKKSEKVLWKDRRFALPFPRVLEKAKEFVLSIEEELILVELAVEGKGSFWASAIQDAGWTKRGTDERVETLSRSFSGPPAEVAEEIEAYFNSYKPFNVKQGRPKDPLVLVFQVKTPRYEDLPEPEVQIVEVAVVEEHIVEKEVEVPVYIVVEWGEDPKTQLEDPRAQRARQITGPILDEEHLRAIIEVEVETRLRERA